MSGVQKVGLFGIQIQDQLVALCDMSLTNHLNTGPVHKKTRWCLKSGPIANRTLFEHFKSSLVQISDPIIEIKEELEFSRSLFP